MPRVQAVVELAYTFVVAPECLSMTAPVAIDGLEQVLHMPRRAPSDRKQIVAPSELEGRLLDSEIEPDERLWGFISRSRKNEADGDYVPTGITVGKVLLVGDIPDRPDDAHRFASEANAFGKPFDRWYEIAILWIEAWTGQIIRMTDRGTSRSQGHVEGVNSDNLSGWSPGAAVSIQTGLSPVTPEILRGALDMASRGQEVSLAWRFLSNAHGALDKRQRVVDASTAAEIAIDRALRGRLATTGLTTEQVDAIVNPLNGIVRKHDLLYKLFESGDSRLTDLRNTVKDDLATPRNKAAHSGNPILPAEAIKCVQVAAEVVARYDPIPPPQEE